MVHAGAVVLHLALLNAVHVDRGRGAAVEAAPGRADLVVRLLQVQDLNWIESYHVFTRKIVHIRLSTRCFPLSIREHVVSTDYNGGC